MAGRVTVVRKDGIGASEYPGMAGLSPWATPTSVWLEKVDLAPGQRETAPMRTGKALERALLGVVAVDIDTPIKHNAVTFPHPGWPDVPLYATPDGFGPRRQALFEVKVVGFRGADWSDGPPPYVLAQVQAQLACLPRVREGIIGALIGSDVRTFTVERDDQLGERIADDVAAWWSEFVVGLKAPPAGTDDDRWAITRALITPVMDRIERIATDPEEIVAAELAVLLGHADDIAAQVAERRLLLAEASAESDLIGSGGWRASWHERTTTDWHGVVRDERIPSRIVEAYRTTSPVFTFRRAKETATP